MAKISPTPDCITDQNETTDETHRETERSLCKQLKVRLPQCRCRRRQPFGCPFFAASCVRFSSLSFALLLSLFRLFHCYNSKAETGGSMLAREPPKVISVIMAFRNLKVHYSTCSGDYEIYIGCTCRRKSYQRCVCTYFKLEFNSYPFHSTSHHPGRSFHDLLFFSRRSSHTDMAEANYSSPSLGSVPTSMPTSPSRAIRSPTSPPSSKPRLQPTNFHHHPSTKF